ncbi:hypothetical protein GY45DRAFT_19424 [Cubamyces sp. BRFM 1775]|nr:hypothetical protein GY45DRAFT_19424 [Cubamyces sp. BRFM 1775]
MFLEHCMRARKEVFATQKPRRRVVIVVRVLHGGVFCGVWCEGREWGLPCKPARTSAACLAPAAHIVLPSGPTPPEPAPLASGPAATRAREALCISRGRGRVSPAQHGHERGLDSMKPRDCPPDSESNRDSGRGS